MERKDEVVDRRLRGEGGKLMIKGGKWRWLEELRCVCEKESSLCLEV